MKILFAQNIEGIAGSEKYFWQILPALKHRGVEVEFLSVHRPQFKEVSEKFSNVLRQHNIVVHEIETKSYLSISLLKKIKSLLSQRSFEIFHTHLIYADFWSACLKSFFGLKNVITISTLHGYQESIYTAYCLKPKEIPHNRYYRIAKFTYKRIDHVYACSHGLKSFFLEAGIKFKHEPEVIHHGFDYPTLNENKIEYDSGDFVCAIPGRLVPRKGHILVLHQLKNIASEISKFKLVIIGDGPSRKELEDYCQENGIRHLVEFTGNVPDVRPKLLAADLVLIPSYAEGLPLVIFEAMSLAKTVVAFDTIGPAEVIDNGKNGFLISPFNEEEFASKIIELYHQKEDLNRIGEAAKNYVLENHTLLSMVEKTIGFYKRHF